MIEVIRPGTFTTLQDHGRRGYHHLGVSPGGAMDQVSFEMATLLVGNSLQTAALEITFAGAELFFHESAVIALAGADLGALLEERPVSTGKRIYVPAGATIRFAQQRAGCRVYLAVEGGFEIPRVMGSESTLLIAGVGGGYGRPLQKGDTLAFRQTRSTSEQANWFIDTHSHWSSSRIRFWKGPEWASFSDKSHHHIHSSTYHLSREMNRMGYRLKGPHLETTSRSEMISEAVTVGTIQVPPGGAPIILMADGQTTGGYPRIGQVAQVDLPILAQKRPGDELYFELISLDEARQLQQIQRLWRNEVRAAINWKLRRGGTS